MAYAALGKLKKNSPEATLTAGIDDTTGTIPVDHLEYFHDDDGTLIVKGIVLGPDTSTITETEEITITGASGTTGAGNLTGGTRGVNADGTVGAAKAWDSGTVIKVTYTTGIHNQIADNFAKIQTTAAMSVYVDAAATGAADGTSWTDAFTTIQAALNSLPTLIEHDTTIYVRKGASAYDENVSVQRIIGAGSITISGEYYWTGGCAAAATPSTTKFNITATDGAQIAAGDPVLIRDGYADYTYGAVVATVDKGSNVWEIEIDTALPTGNIGTGDYYTICKTKLVTTTGAGITLSTSSTITGLFVQSGNSSAVVTVSATVSVTGCFCLGYTTSRAIQQGGSGEVITVTKSYLYSSTTGVPYWGTASGGAASIGGVVTNGCVIASGGNSTGGVVGTPAMSVLVQGSVIDVQAGTGVSVSRGCAAYVNNITISPSGRTAAAIGLKAITNAIIQKAGTVTNNATTPESPSGASDASYIGT